MKKIYLSILFLILIFSNTIFANCLGDISQIGNASCITDYSDDTDVESMDTVTFGSYPQSSASSNEPIEWIVLEKQGDKALLLSKYILNYIRYSKEGLSSDELFEKSTWKWQNSNFKTWLNNNFLSQAFNSDEKNRLSQSSSFGDKIFILDRNALNKYFNINSYQWFGGLSGEPVPEMKNKDIAYNCDFDNEITKLGTEDTEYAVTCHDNILRSKGYPDTVMYNNTDYRPYIFYDINDYPEFISSSTIGHSDGFVDDGGSVGVRPAIWVSLNGQTSISNSTSNDSISYDYYDEFLGEMVHITDSKREDAVKFETITVSSEEEKQRVIQMFGWDPNWVIVEGQDASVQETTIVPETTIVQETTKVPETTKAPETKPVENVLGDNVNIEGANVIQNPDGSIQIGGVPEEGAIILQGDDSESSQSFYEIILTNEDILNIGASEEENKFLFLDLGTDYYLNIYLNENAINRLADASKIYLNSKMYLVYDNKLLIEFKVDKHFGNDDEGIKVPYSSKTEVNDRVDKLRNANSIYLIAGDYQKFINENNNTTKDYTNVTKADTDKDKDSGTTGIRSSSKAKKEDKKVKKKTNLTESKNKGVYVEINKQTSEIKLDKDIIKSITVEKESVDGVPLDTMLNEIFFSTNDDRYFVKIVLDFSHIPLQEEMQNLYDLMHKGYISGLRELYTISDECRIKSIDVEQSMVFCPDILKLYVDDKDTGYEVIKSINEKVNKGEKTSIGFHYSPRDFEKGYYMSSPISIGVAEIEIVPGNKIINAKAYIKFDNDIKEKLLSNWINKQYLVLVKPDFYDDKSRLGKNGKLLNGCQLKNDHFVAYELNKTLKKQIENGKIEINIEDVVGHPLLDENGNWDATAEKYYNVENMKKVADEFPNMMIMCYNVRHYVVK